jgi:LacI family transcriptional regulator
MGNVVAVTIKQVAREAGVSIATVSRVLTGNGPVLATTRARILEVAARLRYVPHEGARGLATQRTHAIGVLLPDIHSEFFSELIRGLDQNATARGYHLLVSGSHGAVDSLEVLLRTMRGRVDGLIVMAPDLDRSVLREVIPDAVPLVTLASPAEPGVDSIEVDDRGGRRRWCVTCTRSGTGASPSCPALAASAARGRVCADSRRRWQRSPGRRRKSWRGTFGVESGRRAAEKLLSSRRRPDAVFAANDAMALGLLSGLRERGWPCPARWPWPASTTFRWRVSCRRR